MEEDNKLIEERREKLKGLRAKGVAFPNDFRPKHHMGELATSYGSLDKPALEDSKTDIGWGHQIRSYVLDQSRIKDLRTNYEVGNTQAVLDGGLDDFIAASLKQGV